MAAAMAKPRGGAIPSSSSASVSADAGKLSMALDKAYVTELLLISSALGQWETCDDDPDLNLQALVSSGSSAGGSGNGLRFVRGLDSSTWLDDFVRFLKRDDMNVRSIAITIANWKVLPEKLLPLLMHSPDDLQVATTIAKICVQLTEPLSVATKFALTQLRSIPKKDKLKGKAKKMKEQERKEKEADARAARGEEAQGDNDGEEESTARGEATDDGPSEAAEEGTVSDDKRKNAEVQLRSLQLFKRAFLAEDVIAALASMLERSLSIDAARRTHRDIMVLDLVVNLIANLVNIPDVEPTSVHSLSDPMTHMQEDFACLLSKGLVLNLLGVLAASASPGREANWSLLLLDIFHALLCPYSLSDLMAAKDYTSGKGSQPKGSGDSHLKALFAQSVPVHPSRHSRFGGAIISKDGRTVFGHGPTAAVVPQATRRGKANRGRGAANLSAASRTFTAGLQRKAPQGVKSMHAKKVLCNFALAFIPQGYQAFMASLKDEFRKDTSRLQPSDKPKFFQLTALLMGLHRRNYAATKSGSSYPIGAVMETMDMLVINMVRSECELATDQRDVGRLETCTQVVVEIVQTLALLCASDGEAHQILSLGLLSVLFYQNESLDILPHLLRGWLPGVHSHRYVCLLAELAHVTLKVLEMATNPSQFSKLASDASQSGLILQAREFEVRRYFLRIANNKFMLLYTILLEQFAANGPRVNYYVMTMINRIRSTKSARSTKLAAAAATEGWEEEIPSLEPLLYKIRILSAMEKILSDRRSRQGEELADLGRLLEQVIRNLAGLAQQNPLTYVELLMPQPRPDRYCALVQRHYVEGDESSYANEAAALHEAHDMEVDTELPAPHIHNGSVSEEAQVAGAPAFLQQDVAGPAEEEWDDGVFAPVSHVSRGSKAASKKQPKKKRGSDRALAGCGSRPPKWTTEEDDYLRENYPKYASAASGLTVLSASEILEKNSRTKDQIARRARHLKLSGSDSFVESYSSLLPPSSDSSSDSESDSDPPRAKVVASPQRVSVPDSPKPVRKLLGKRRAESSDSSEDDEALTEGRTVFAPERPAPVRKLVGKSRFDLSDSSDDEGDIVKAAPSKAVKRTVLLDESDDE